MLLKNKADIEATDEVGGVGCSGIGVKIFFLAQFDSHSAGNAVLFS
jgi:hypothetical protein